MNDTHNDSSDDDNDNDMEDFETPPPPPLQLSPRNESTPHDHVSTPCPWPNEREREPERGNINPFDIDTYEEPGSINIINNNNNNERNERNERNQVTSPTTNTMGVLSVAATANTNTRTITNTNTNTNVNGRTPVFNTQNTQNMTKAMRLAAETSPTDENHPENYDSFDINHNAVETMSKINSSTGGSGSGLKDKLMTIYIDERDLDNKEKSTIGSYFNANNVTNVSGVNINFATLPKTEASGDNSNYNSSYNISRKHTHSFQDSLPNISTRVNGNVTTASTNNLETIGDTSMAALRSKSKSRSWYTDIVDDSKQKEGKEGSEGKNNMNNMNDNMNDNKSDKKKSKSKSKNRNKDKDKEKIKKHQIKVDMDTTTITTTGGIGGRTDHGDDDTELVQNLASILQLSPNPQYNTSNTSSVANNNNSGLKQATLTMSPIETSLNQLHYQLSAESSNNVSFSNNVSNTSNTVNNTSNTNITNNNYTFNINNFLENTGGQRHAQPQIIDESATMTGLTNVSFNTILNIKEHASNTTMTMGSNGSSESNTDQEYVD